MQVSPSILILSLMHLLLLIAGANIFMQIWVRYRMRCRAAGALQVMMQTANLALLLRCLTGYDIFAWLNEGNANAFIIVQLLFALVLLIRIYFVLRKVSVHRNSLLSPQTIRETIDNLPGGLSISTVRGKPILTNRRMNELVYAILGHTVLNVLSVWGELAQGDGGGGCMRLEDAWMNPTFEYAAAAKRSAGVLERGYAPAVPGSVELGSVEPGSVELEAGSIYYSLPDGSIWRFSRTELTSKEPHYIQLDATDVTDIYRYSRDLYESNTKLAEQYRRQQALLDNIVQINFDKEILSTKMRIHDDLGRSILTTKQHLSNGTINDNIKYLAEVWGRIVRGFKEYSHDSPEDEKSPEAELINAAEMIGCQIVFEGERPIHRKSVLLLYAAVREALTNAVLHAKADRLIVTIKPVSRGHMVEISDNGSSGITSLIEGNGLGNLRKRLEQEGASLDIVIRSGVMLRILIPGEENTRGDE
ncbi:MAG: hypothetical protein FWH33_08315 [Oscillospiraceae bacterium]|nr:hypothetical protein [Oscillospiraceae bacterium]